MAARSSHLVVYVGEGPASRMALDSLRRLCDERLDSRCTLKVVDITKNPEMAQKHNILAVPTLVRELPLPVKRIIGCGRDLDQLARALDIR